MFPNTITLLCDNQSKYLQSFSPLIHLQQVPFHFLRQSDYAFYYADTKDNLSTNIHELSFDKEGNTKNKIIEEFMGLYEYCGFGDDHAFLMNREGDIIYYDLLNKDTHFVEKQHPSLYCPLQILNLGEHFVTVGGNVKNSIGENEKIIKLWHAQDDQLQNKARIVTGHTRQIQNSLILGQNKILSMSTDKTLRVCNLSTQQLEQLIRVNNFYYSGVATDWSTVMVAGLSKSIDIFDTKSRKLINTRKLDIPVVQISEITRTGPHLFLFSNINHIYSLDIRTFKIIEKGTYDGQRITKIQAINQDTLVIGNRDKTFQLWKFY